MAKSTRKKADKPAASLIEGNKETPIAVEEIQAPQPLAVITAEKKAEMEIARYDVAGEWIAQKKEAYQGLEIAGLDDKEGYKAVTAAWQEVRNKRLAVQNKHTEIKADYLVITRKIDEEKNRLVGLLKEIEEPLKAKLDKIEEEKEAAKRELERKAQEKLDGRVETLISNGMAFNGRFYAIGEVINVDIVTLKALDDDEFTRLLERVQKENQAILDAQAEKERKEQEEREAQEKKRLELEETERQQKEKQAELDRQQEALDKQKRDMIAARSKARGKLLEAIGMTYNWGNRYFEFNTQDFGGLKIAVGGVEGMEDEQWEPEYESIASRIKELKDQQAVKDNERKEAEAKAEKERQEAEAAAEKRRTLIATRKAELMAEGLKEQPDGSFIRRFDFPEIEPLLITRSQIENYEPIPWSEELVLLHDNKLNAFSLQENMQKKKDAAAEAARLAALSDAEKVREYYKHIRDEVISKWPQVGDGPIAAALKAFDSDVAAALKKLLTVLDSVK